MNGEQVLGWRVFAGTKKERAKSEFDLKWAPISQRFTVRSSAEQFCDLARKQYPGKNIEIRADRRDDGMGGR